MPSNSADNTLAFFWDGPLHGTTQEIEGCPMYYAVDEIDDPYWREDIYPVDVIPPTSYTVTHYKRAAVSSGNPRMWRYDYVGNGF